MKRKILLYYMVLVVIGVTITGFFTSQLSHKFYKHEVEEKLKNTARLMKYQIASYRSEGRQLDYNEMARTYAGILNNSRVTFVDFGGTVLGESDEDYREMENHLDRKEIVEAIRGNIGRDIRRSHTLGVDFLYIAVPLESSPVVLRISVPLLQLQKIDQIIWYYTVAGIIAGLVLTSLLALRFSYQITAPVQELMLTAREISKGNYSKRALIKTRDELGELSDTFNEMAAKLEKTVAELKDKNLKVDTIMNNLTNGIVAVDAKFRIILINAIACELFSINSQSDAMGQNIISLIRHNQINNCLKDTVEKNTSMVQEIIMGTSEEKIFRIYTNPIKSPEDEDANIGGIVSIHDITNVKKLEQIRTEFVSNVTHELKTPLTSIRGFIETLRSGAMNDREVADKFLEIIDIEAERLYMLINDILQLSEIETRQKDINVGIYSLKPIISEVTSILEGVAEKKGVHLDFQVEDDLKIVANKDRVKQMLINLVENAIKYNVENGSVKIRASKGQGKIEIAVKDTGIGIAREHLPRIFERFYRVDKGRSRNMGGTGLGLSIVKHIINLYNGDIKVISQPGVGTEFVIQLPV